MRDILGVIFFTWLLPSLGLRKMLEKLHWKKMWMAWVPGLRFYALGSSIDAVSDGIGFAFVEIVFLLFRLLPTPQNNKTVTMIIMLVIFASLITYLVFTIRMFLRITVVFRTSKWWLVPAILADWIPLLFLGFSPKYQPQKVSFSNEEIKAGTKPADISGTGSRSEMPAAIDSGLSIRLKERTIKRLTGKKRYLLRDIAMDVPNGSMVLLLGGSGAGKTTFVNAVIGYEKANAEILLNGTDVYKHYDKMKYRIGFVPQKNLIRGNDTVMRTVTDAAKLRIPSDVPKEQRKERVKEVMDLLGLSPGAAGLVSKKSGGQLRRISIAMELVSDPDLFVLDEPDSGLDGVIAREIFEKLRGIADQGKIVMAITHTPDRVIDMFDKVIVLARDSGRVGRLAFYGSPDEAREFFGKKTMEGIVMSVNGKEQGGDGLADEYIARFNERSMGKKPAVEPAEDSTESEAEAPDGSGTKASEESRAKTSRENREKASDKKGTKAEGR